MEHPSKMDDLRGTPILGNLHIGLFYVFLKIFLTSGFLGIVPFDNSMMMSWFEGASPQYLGIITSKFRRLIVFISSSQKWKLVEYLSIIEYMIIW